MTYPNLCVVGDPDQSIYKWRGSDIRNILDFERDFPNAKVITLAQNYRSTKAILHAASTLIDHNKQRKKKTLITDNPAGEPVKVIAFDNGLDEAEGIVERIKAGVKEGKQKYGDCAVFLRVNALTRSLESAFVKHGVPFQIVKGLAFFERKENRDVLAYLRLIVNPADAVSFLRVVNEPARGIGKTSLEKLQAWAAANEISLLAAAGQVARITEIRGKAATGLRDFYRIMAELRAAIEHPPHEIIPLVLDKSGYREMLRTSDNEEDAERLANIEEVVTAAKQFYEEDNSRTLTDFLEQIALASDVDGWDEDSDHVSVMTLHAAKGLEFPVVYLMAVEQGLLPHERSLGREEDLEEERRLCFVGMTRAKRELHLTHARCREFRGSMLYAVRSMFLDELSDDVEQIDKSGERNSARNAIDDWRARAGYTHPGSPIPEPIQPFKPTIPDGQNGDYEEGQVVQHESYGIGKITNVSGFGALRKVKIRFPSEGEKTFVADKVKLRVVKKS
jgi:DNA helicase-2/ATP-dependent DNA helicase PcrA